MSDALMSEALARADAAQLEASDPEVSAFVAASAGSGKTKLLTDRLLRLMLAGADPARILCLTFTKAAAAEMALRLQHTLGTWVTLDDAALDGRLHALRVAATPEARATARALFARVLDLPGGMRIGTIHGFCQSLLRRFPLEAQVSPHFRIVEDSDARAALAEAREAMLAEADAQARAALDELAGLVSADGFAALVDALQSDRARLQRLLQIGPDALAAAQYRLANAPPQPLALLLSRVCDWPEAAALAAALRTGHAHPKTTETMRVRLTALLDWLAMPPALRAERWEAWRDLWLTLAGTPRQHSAFYPKAQASALAGLAAACSAEQARVLAAVGQLRALRVAGASAALLRLAAPVLHRYAAGKDRAALLDYGDLIGLTSHLLVDPGAAWVLFKLDGGLDHLLLDEVQDTAPAQWEIAHALTAEFFAGSGARPAGRSCFAVGDRKQSIYSFQGADIGAFDAARETLRARVTQAGLAWRDTALDVSFRSAAPVLALVDAVFADAAASAGVAPPGSLHHHVLRAGHAGRVELWPLAPQEPPPPRAPWTVPERNEGLRSAPQRLAEHLAGWIAAETGGRVALPSRGRALAPGDVLVLVRRRGDFARALVAALKLRGVPVAGLDRLVLTEQPAVQDLLALCEVLLLPQDELALACVLTSPLGGLDDDSLGALAMQRDGTLWEALRRRADERADWQAAWRFLAALFARVDYAAPHALLAEALGPLGGRARLLARLGPEAAEPIDELLGRALDYAATHPPALQGFLHWLRQSGAEVKREADAAGGVVRVMTVHGAKGLQAPLVILPDTVALPPDRASLVWQHDTVLDVDVPLWTPRQEFGCSATDALHQQRQDRAAEEQNRLLYVALTRAEDRLVICGWQPGRALPERCWYSMVRAGFARLPAQAAPFAGWEGDALALESPQTALVRLAPAARAAPAAALPDWAGAAPLWQPAPPPPEPPAPLSLAPSRPEGVALGPVPSAASPLAARDAAGLRFRRGRLVHALLQHLPALAEAARPAAALAYLRRPGHGLTAAAAAEVAADVLAVLAHAALAPLFAEGSRAEVPLTGVVGGRVVGGLVDRLAVRAEAVLLADFKTSRDPPATAAATPAAYLRQMAAYRDVLRAIYPDRPVRCALVWTQGARVALLDDALLDQHAPA